MFSRSPAWILARRQVNLLGSGQVFSRSSRIVIFNHRVSFATTVTPEKSSAFTPTARSTETREDLIRQKVRVVSLYAAKGIRLAQLARRITEESKKRKENSKWYITDDKNAGLLVFSLRPKEQPIQPSQPNQKPFPRQASHVVVSKQGPVVLINISFQNALDILKHINDPSQNIAAQLPGGKKSAMDYATFKINNNIDNETWCYRGDGEGSLIVKRMDLNNVKLIAAAMSQSVVLQYYEELVESQHGEMSRLNDAISREQFDSIRKPTLTKLLGSNNRVRNVVWSSTMGRRHSPAWKEEKYYRFEQLLMDEFALRERWEDLNAQLEYIENILKFILERKANKHEHKLETIIVIILVLELLASLGELREKWYAEDTMFGINSVHRGVGEVMEKHIGNPSSDIENS
eukprot:gb/GECG01005034.1/.p1 GENE.gb/GECG01005034.1/~~gb/GECG01005034.1/.p1  ORF type:complete len:404 (+),score=52.04 gb/GECG01005034.1/:1-1212(+)